MTNRNLKPRAGAALTALDLPGLRGLYENLKPTQTTVMTRDMLARVIATVEDSAAREKIASATINWRALSRSDRQHVRTGLAMDHDEAEERAENLEREGNPAARGLREHAHAIAVLIEMIDALGGVK